MKKNYFQNYPTKLLLFGIFWLISVTTMAQCTITGMSNVCVNQTKPYATTDTGTTYLWNATGGGIVTGTGTSVNVTWLSVGSGQVTLAIKDIFGNVISTCTKNITIHALPNPVITPSFMAGCAVDTSKQGTAGDKRGEKCYVACDSTTILYTTPMNVGSTYTWSVTGLANWSSSTNTATVYWTGVGAGTVKVKEVDIWGCEKEVEICVQIVGKPKAKFITYPGLVGVSVNACKGQVIQFVNQSVAGMGSPIISYTWVYGDGVTNILSGTSNGNDTHSYNTAGSYTAMLIVENECHCKDTAFVNINVSSLPGPKIECVSTVCPGTTVTYTTNATGCTSYAWSVTNGTPIGSSTSPTFTVQWGSSNPGIVTLAVNCGSFCNSPTSVFVPIITPTATIKGPSRVCQFECYTYKLDCNIPVDSIKWSFPSGVTVMSDSINVHKVLVCFNNAVISGNITANYYHYTPGAVPALNCGGTATKSVAVKPKMFSYGTTEICENQAYSYGISTSLTGNVYWTITNSLNVVLASNTVPANSTFSGTWTAGPGLFTVKINDTTLFCDGPKTRLLRVHPLPPKPDSINGPKKVCPGYAYTYSATPTNGSLAIGWKVLNGTPSSGVGNTISVVWNASGPYQVAAFQINPITGCKSDTIQYLVGSLLPQPASPIIGNITPCANSNENYSTTADGTLFEWSISPSIAGSVNTGQYGNAIGIQWNNFTGPVIITLKTTVCGVSRTDNYNVTLTGVPTPVITAPPTACQGTAVTVSSTGAATYSWNYGDGSPIGSGASNSHAFLVPGNLVITLNTTYGGSCPGTGVATKTIFVNPKPTVSISTPQLTQYCIAPISNTFYTSAPVVPGITYQWFMGVTNTGVTTPTYSVTAVGTYFVVATNPITGCTDTSNRISIAIITCTPCTPNTPYTLDFTRFRLGCSKDSFVANGSAGVGNYAWNFDDPYNATTASGTPATHSYTEPGYYKVELCADVPSSTSSTGFCRVCIFKVDTIKYIPNFIDSAYCINNADSVKTKIVNQTKILTGIAAPTWSWSVSPGGYTSTLKDPIFTLAPNTYTVTLTVGGVCSFVKTLTIGALPNASFTVLDSVCVGRPILFNNTSTGLFNSSSWTFGDTASSLITSPIRSYSTAGLFNVVLTISNAFGCTDTAMRNVRVLPNTLATSIIPNGPIRFCEGDSVQLNQFPLGGYPGYTYLWSNVALTKNIWAFQTGTYFVSVTDSKGCFARSSNVNVTVKSKPRPKIIADKYMCLNSLYQLTSTYPSIPGATYDWYLDGSFYSSSSALNYFAGVSGPHQWILNITSADTCMGSDTFNFSVHNNPNVTISGPAVLCSGTPNVLFATSTTVPFPSLLWSTGQTSTSITVYSSQTYGVTATDTFGCKASAFKVVHPLPDLCGLMVGCYDICDTVTNLVWDAPKGYALYQWYFNGTAIPWATSDTFHVPLYQAGTYTVKITTSYGCSITSPPININFISCGNCKFNITSVIRCDKISVAGNQTYSMTFTVNNSLGAGAGYSISSPDGLVFGISPATLAAGVNTVTAFFEDIPPVTGSACFNFVIYNTIKKCDTTYCVRLPECPVENCKLITKVEKFECAGYDGSGNPQYYVCLNITWGGSNGSTLTLNAASSSFTANPVTINNGSQTICYTYTDLPPTTGFVTIYATAFDPSTGKSCRDSVRQQYKPCPRDSCILEMYGYCATCKKQTATGQWIYGIDVTVFNPFAGPANVVILPIGSGTFGTISPNPIPAGMQMFSALFTPNPSVGGIICFKVVLTEVATGKVCYKTICISLPPCDGMNLSVAEFEDASITLYPNPAKTNVTIAYTFDDAFGKLQFDVVDVSGKKVATFENPIDANALQINTSNWNSGVYFINVIKDNRPVGTLKLVVLK